MRQKLLVRSVGVVLVLALSAFGAAVSNVLIDFNFQSTTLPDGVTHGEGYNLSTSGSINSCTECTSGRLEIPINGWFQVDVPAASVLIVKMKSSGATARTVTVKYKHSSTPDYTTAGTVSVVQAGTGVYSLIEIFPAIAATGPVSVRLENAASGGMFHIHDLYVEGNAVPSSNAEILSFKLKGQIGDEVINSEAATVNVAMPLGSELSAVVPSVINVSPNATLDPLPNIARDFSNEQEVLYTVTAQDGESTKVWRVKVTEVASSEKEIVSFKLSHAQIGSAIINSANGTVTVTMPIAEDLADLVPVTFSISSFATIHPLVNVAQNFSFPVVYTITAQDESTKQWTIHVQSVDPDEIFFDYQAEEAEFTGKIDNQHANYTGTGFIDFLSSGDNYIIFTVCQQETGSRTAKFRYSLGKDEVRTGSLFVNDEFVSFVEFPPTATFTEWAEASAVVSLTAGINSVKLTWDETDGPNLDKLSLSGGQCASYNLSISTTNNGVVSASPERANGKYFDVETVTLLAENKPNLVFAHWSGDVTGTDNPVQLLMNADKSVTANFNVVNTYTLNVTVSGIGEVLLDPPGRQYADGTVVTLTAVGVLGSTFSAWGGDLSGNTSPESIVMNANKSVTAAFTSDININFEVPVGFASVNTGTTYPEFNGPVTGGQHAQDTLWVNGAADFDMLAWHLYYRNRAYRNLNNTNGVPKAPLVIVFKEGVYPEGSSTSSAWGNSMMTVQEQGDLTIIGQGNVVLNWGFNIKRSWNILIRNLTFQDYYDDGINIGEPETHHIWVDHCTFGHPTTRPANTEHPDGGVDVKAGASYVTVSWCTFRNSWKTNLIGHSDSNESQDLGKLKVTLYGNYYFNSNSRNPRTRFGEVHVLNNLEEDITLYGIAASNKSQVYAENNFYLNTRWPMYADRATADFRAVYGNNTDNVFTSKTGNRECTGLKAVGNEYDDSGLPVITAQINPNMLNPSGRSVKFDEHNPQNVFNPSTYYSYTAFPASVVRTIVPIFAGAQKINFFQPPGAVTGTITATGTLNPFTQTLGTPSSVQSYSVSASNLTRNMTITPPASYEVSTDGTTWFTSSTPLVLNPVSGSISSTTISIRLNAMSAGGHSGVISHTSDNVVSVNIEVTGTTTATAPTPVIFAAGMLNAFTQTIGSPSAVQTYTVWVENLTGIVTITPPLNFEVSADGGITWKTNASPLTLSPTGGSIESTTVFVRLNATSGGAYTGNVSHTSVGAITVNVSVTGEAAVITALPELASAVFNVSPNPANDYLVIRRDDSSVNAVLTIYTPTGVKKLVQGIHKGSHELLIDVRDFAQGIYFIEYTTVYGRITLRLIKL